MTLIGGLLVVLPFWVNLLLLFKAIKSALAPLQPIAKFSAAKTRASRRCGTVSVDVDLFCGWFGHSHKTGPALRRLAGTSFPRSHSGFFDCPWYDSTVSWSERRAVVRTCTGREIEEALVPAFIIGKHADGQFTVFVRPAQRRWPAPFISCNPNARIP